MYEATSVPGSLVPGQGLPDAPSPPPPATGGLVVAPRPSARRGPARRGSVAIGGAALASFFGPIAGEVQYRVYGNDGLGGPIDYATPLAAVGATTWSAGTLAPGAWAFGVRAFDGNGEEQNADCAATIVLDPEGNDITNRPAPPYGLRAVPTAAGGIRAEWWSPAVRGPAAPAGFRVYVGVGAPDYGSAAATVPGSAGVLGAYWATIGGLDDGQEYAVAVRAYNDSGEETNTATVAATANAGGPPGVDSITATAIV